jgi:hypothetical protein
MQAHRTVIETDEHGRPKEMPILPPHARVEAIFLVLDEEPASIVPRRPPPSLAGIKILGDIVAPAFDESDWSLGS